MTERGRLFSTRMIVFVCLMLLTLMGADFAVAGLLTIPENVEVIEEEAFFGDESLEQVILPDGIERIEERAFAESSIHEINFPSSLQYIADDAFENSQLISVTAEEDTVGWTWGVDHDFIIPKATSIAMDAEDITLIVGESITLNATVEPQKAGAIDLWRSSNESIAFVENGIVTARGRGTAIIYAEKDGISISCRIRCETPFQQRYWVIFMDGTRNRIEASSVDSSAENLSIVWNGGLRLNNSSGASFRIQYYLNPYGQWIRFGTWSALSGSAKSVIASNLDIVDQNGNLVLEKRTYADVDLYSLLQQVDGSQDGKILYEFVNNEAIITGYTGDALNTITIPSTIDGKPVTKIGDYAFYNNTRIGTQMILPASLTSIGAKAFANSSIERINFHESINFIAEDAFEGANLNHVEAEIESYAFNWAVRHEYISIVPAEEFYLLSEYASAPFDNTINLETQVIPENCNQRIHWYSSDESIATVTDGVVKPENIGTVTITAEINGIERTCEVEFTLDPSYDSFARLTYIGDTSHFDAGEWNMIGVWESLNNNIATVDQNGNVKAIGSGITTVILRSAENEIYKKYLIIVNLTRTDDLADQINHTLKNDGTYELTSFKGSLTNPVLPSYINGRPVTSIANNAFAGSSIDGQLTLPENLIGIGYDAFTGCNSLNGSLTIPSTVTSIGDRAFMNCSGFTGQLYLPDNVLTLGELTFYGCSGFSSLRLSDSLVSIPGGAFGYCTGLKGELVLPQGLKSIMDSYRGWIGRDQPGAFEGCTGLTGTLMIPANVTNIEYRAFKGCTGFTGLVFESNVLQVISADVFNGCTGFSNDISLPSSVTTIGNNAFVNCSNLKGTLDLSAVTSIGGGSFAGCSGITGLILPEGITNIPDSCFKSCTGITGELNIPSRVTVIEKEAFYNCAKFTAINFPSTLRTIKDGAFAYCYGLEGTLTLPDSLTEIGGLGFRTIYGTQYIGAFINCNKITAINWPNNIITIGTDAFRNCTGLTGELVLPNSLLTIGVRAFMGCSNLTGNLNIPDKVSYIGDNSFEGTGFNGTLHLPYGLQTIGHGAFKNLSALHGELLIPMGTVQILNEAFLGCSGFTGSLLIPNSVTTIGNSTFKFCTGFTGDLLISSSVTSIDRMAFNCCSGFTYLAMSPNVTSIGLGVFGGMTGLTGTLFIPEGVTYIGQYAFQACTGIERIRWPETLKKVDCWAFENCTNLEGNILFPDALETLSYAAFRNSPKLNDCIVIVPDESNIDGRAFDGINVQIYKWTEFLSNTDILSKQPSPEIVIRKPDNTIAVIFTPEPDTSLYNTDYKLLSYTDDESNYEIVDNEPMPNNIYDMGNEQNDLIFESALGNESAKFMIKKTVHIFESSKSVELFSDPFYFDSPIIYKYPTIACEGTINGTAKIIISNGASYDNYIVGISANQDDSNIIFPAFYMWDNDIYYQRITSGNGQFEDRSLYSIDLARNNQTISYWLFNCYISNDILFIGDCVDRFDFLPIYKPVVNYSILNEGIRISWNAIPNASRYEIYYSLGNEEEYELYQITEQTETLIAAEANGTVCNVKIRAVRDDEGITVYSEYDELQITLNENTPVSRMLSFFEINYTDETLFDAIDSIDYIIHAFDRGTPYGLPLVFNRYYNDLNKQEIFDTIRTSLVQQANENDISIIQINGHGRSSIRAGENAGSIKLVSGEELTFNELASVLNEVPGKIILILGSCGSGSAIGENGLYEGEGFFHWLFSEIAGWFAPFRTEKYVVIAGAIGGSSSLYHSGEFVGYGYRLGFTDIAKYFYKASLYGDSNNDGIITVSEAGNFMKVNAMAEHPDQYDENGKLTSGRYVSIWSQEEDFVLFQK